MRSSFSMKKFLTRLLVGFVFSTIIAICVHLRGNAIQEMPPIAVLKKPTGVGMSKDDFVKDIGRIRDEVYDPIRPVSKEGSLMLKLEKAAYASPVILFSAALSPSFLPAFAYSEQLRQDQRRRLPLGADLPDSIGGAAQAEGLAWGVAQGVAFYLPFWVGRRKKTKEGDKSPNEHAPNEHAPNEPRSLEQSVLDSAINKCDD